MSIYSRKYPVDLPDNPAMLLLEDHHEMARISDLSQCPYGHVEGAWSCSCAHNRPVAARQHWTHYAPN